MKTPILRLFFLCVCIFILLPEESLAQTNAWINELHYDNSGSDTNEAVEIIIENPGTLSDYEIFLYNGNDGENYDSETVDNVTHGTTAGNFTVYTWYPGSIQNGSPDGVALAYQGNLIQFLSYEGSFTAADGPANGELSVDIGVDESGTSTSPIDFSLQLQGSGEQYSDYTWASPAMNTFGAFNTGQSLGSVNIAPQITNVIQNPSTVLDTDVVSVSADITDADGINSVTFHWGTTSGNLSNSISMSVSSGDTYITSTDIPVQTIGTTVYYEIEATDNNPSSETTTSLEYSYEVTGLSTNTSFWSEPFDDDTQYTATLGGEGTDGTSDYFFRTDGSNINKTYTFIEGDFFAGQDIDDGGWTGSENPSQLTWSGINISGFTSLEFSSDFASVATDKIDVGDFLLIEYRVDNGTWNSLIAFHNDGSTFNTFFSEDTDFDGVGEGTQLSSDFHTFTKSIAETGSILDIRFTASVDSGDEDFAIDNLILSGTPTSSTTYTYNTGSWTPTDPSGVALATDNIEVISGTTTLTADTEINNITVDNGAVLQVEAELNLHGDMTINGDLIFASSSVSQTGTLGPVPASSSVTGEVTVERYIPAKRAFRLLSSPVSTSTSIHENWQEDVNNTGTNFPTDNINPNPGYGTHITGSMTGANGLDATPSGNTSLFTLDNSTQLWSAITNTNTTTLTAGQGYRLLVRGDRSTNVTDNDAVATNTTLRAKGELATGSVTVSDFGENAGDFNLFGNPYQAAVDMVDVLTNSTNLNTNQYYIWDPNLGTRGAYVTVSLPSGTNSSGSDGNEFLQPGQAAMVTTASNAPASILFEESDKTAAAHTSVFRSSHLEDEHQIVGQLFQSSAYDNGDRLSDSFWVLFSDDYSNNINLKDAIKLFNIDENIGIKNNDKLLSIEKRALPVAGDKLDLFNNNYRTNSYVLKLEVSDLDNVTPVLLDNYTGEETVLQTGENTFSFDVYENNESSATDRFSITFKDSALLSTQNITTKEELVIYPNPINDGNLHIKSTTLNGKEVVIIITNLLGQQIYSGKNIFADNTIVLSCTNSLNSGIYILSLDNGKEIITKKIIKK